MDVSTCAQTLKAISSVPVEMASVLAVMRGTVEVSELLESYLKGVLNLGCTVLK